MMDFPARPLRRKARQGIGYSYRFAHAYLSQKLGMDGSVNWPDPELLESLRRKLVFGKETVAQITCGINISL